MRKIVFWSVAIAAVFSLAACSGGSGTSGASEEDGGTTGEVTQIATLDALPSATDAVQAGSASGSLSKSLAKLGSSGQGNMALGAVTASDFSTTSSKAACEMFNQMRTLIGQAAQGDLTQCYVTKTFEAARQTGASSIDIYDGNYHIFALSASAQEGEGGEDRGPPSKVKVRIMKNTAGYIESFEMFACKIRGGVESQQMYLNQTINGRDFGMTAVNRFNDLYGSGSDKVVVTGKLDESGSFVDSVDGEATPKVVSIQHSFENNEMGQNYWGAVTLNQYANRGDVEGTMKGSNQYNQNACTFTDLVYGVAALIDGNAADAAYSPALLEMGDGLVKASFAGGCGNDSWSDSILEAWDASTATWADPALSAYLDLVTAHTLVETSEPSISFGDGQTWACDGTVEYTIDFSALGVAGLDPMSQCARLESNYQYIDCWNIIERGQEQEGGQEQAGPCVDAGAEAVCGDFQSQGAGPEVVEQCNACFGNQDGIYECVSGLCEGQGPTCQSNIDTLCGV